MSLGAANLIRWAAASMIMLAALVLMAVPAGADLNSVAIFQVALTTTGHAAATGAATMGLSAATPQYLSTERPAKGPCSSHPGYNQCCGTHCPCPSANFISAETAGLNPMLVTVSESIAKQYQPARPAKSPDERPPR